MISSPVTVSEEKISGHVMASGTGNDEPEEGFNGYVMASNSKDFSDYSTDELQRVANRLVASAVGKAVQRVIMEGRMVCRSACCTYL